MTDREKILRGAECCKGEPSANGCPKECPYLPKRHLTCGLDPFLDDVIALLKEQEPSGWISVEDRLPEEGVRVLAVKKLKDGRRDLALATCIPEYKHHDYVTGEDIVEPYWVCGGNNNITHWMPLPEMPEEGTGGK